MVNAYGMPVKNMRMLGLNFSAIFFLILFVLIMRIICQIYESIAKHVCLLDFSLGDAK